MSEDEKIREFDSIEAVLDYAIEKEEEARSFYAAWSERVEHDAIREVFGEFAAQERKHREMLEGIKAGGSFRSKTGGVADLKLADFFLEIEPTPEMTYQDALLLAIQRERHAHEMYVSLSASDGTGELRSLFESLAAEEAKHKLKLESIYDDTFMKED